MVKTDIPPSPSATSRRLVAAVAVAVTTIVAAGLALLRLSRPMGELRLAIVSWPGYEYFYLAELKQLARPFGLELGVPQYSSLIDQRQAYERGDVQAMATTVPEAMAVCHEKPARCPLLVLVLDVSNGADRVMARAPLSRPEQLLGRRVGLERTVLQEYILLRSFGERTIELARDVTLVFDGPEALIQRLRNGELDAAVTYPPYDAPLSSDPRFQSVFSSRQIPGEIADVLAVDPTYARSHPGQVKALVQTWWAARDYARRHPQEARDLMAQRQQISPSQYESTELGLSYPDARQQRFLLAPDGLLMRAMRRMARLMRASDRLSGEAPLPALRRDFLQR